MPSIESLSAIHISMDEIVEVRVNVKIYVTDGVKELKLRWYLHSDKLRN